VERTSAAVARRGPAAAWLPWVELAGTLALRRLSPPGGARRGLAGVHHGCRCCLVPCITRRRGRGREVRG
jgi:hypothetical protein